MAAKVTRTSRGKGGCQRKLRKGQPCRVRVSSVGASGMCHRKKLASAVYLPLITQLQQNQVLILSIVYASAATGGREGFDR